MSVGCWNVRTLHDNSNRPVRWTALVAEGFGMYNFDVVSLLETRFSGEGQLSEVNRYTHFLYR